MNLIWRHVWSESARAIYEISARTMGYGPYEPVVELDAAAGRLRGWWQTLGPARDTWRSPLLDCLDYAAARGRQSEQAQRRTSDDDPVVAAVAAVDHEGVGHVRHSSTVATRSMINRVKRVLP